MTMTPAEARKSAGLSQQYVADALNVTRQAVSNWERRITTPDINQARAYCDVIGVPLEQVDFGPRKRKTPPANGDVKQDAVRAS